MKFFQPLKSLAPALALAATLVSDPARAMVRVQQWTVDTTVTQRPGFPGGQPQRRIEPRRPTGAWVVLVLQSPAVTR